MGQLQRRDAERLLAFLGEAQTIEGPEPFTPELLDQLATVMRCEFATCYRSDLPSGPGFAYVACSNEAKYGASARSLFGGIKPATGFATAREEIATWSDTWDFAARKRFETTPWAASFEVVDAARLSFWLTSTDVATLVLHRQRDDFGPLDRSRLSALRPHFGGLVRAARARELLADLLAAVDAGSSEPNGFVLLESGGRIEHASPAARRLLEQWFDGLHDRLPPHVDGWLRSTAGAEPLRLERQGTRLRIEAATRRALVLSEERDSPPFTPREIEVLRCVAAGRSTAETAHVLSVTPATVSKHLEHVYRKLGVTSRTAALAAVGLTQQAALDSPRGRHA